MSERLHLHYCHGLESGPTGYKVRSLRAWAEVRCPDQQMSLWNLRKRNSIARNWLRQLPKPPRRSLAVMRSLNRCVAIHRDALQDPDVVIGSSWGGLVASVLLQEQIWHGPTLLLCPALWTMERRFPSLAGFADGLCDSLSKIPPELRQHIRIVHGTADTVVPMQDSRKLSERAGLALVEVPQGDHGLGCLVKRGRLRELIEEIRPS